VNTILINTRILSAPLTGTQRYTGELLARWPGRAETICPIRGARGFSGHAWEQFALPEKAGNRLLFCPANTGPLLARNFVVTIHDMSVFDCPETFSPCFARWYQFLLPRLARRARKILTVSEFVKGRIVALSGVFPSKVVVVPLAAAPQFCPQAVSGLDAAVASLGLPSRKYVLVVGSVEPRKNLARLLQAWAQLRPRIATDVWLVIAGTGGEAGAAGKSLVFAGVPFERLPGRVFLTGRVDERWLPALFAGALLLAYVSYYEGFGLPPLEAMASGTAVLAGNRSSLPEVIGDAGMLVDPCNVEEIAEALYGLVQNPALRSDLAVRGLRRAQEFSWDETARKTWDVLQEAALASDQPRPTGALPIRN
jgi:glycosyltransferase involved in cell wall biosynthesis